jgi:hypothetical protein
MFELKGLTRSASTSSDELMVVGQNFEGSPRKDPINMSCACGDPLVRCGFEPYATKVPGLSVRTWSRGEVLHSGNDSYLFGGPLTFDLPEQDATPGVYEHFEWLARSILTTLVVTIRSLRLAARSSFEVNC